MSLPPSHAHEPPAEEFIPTWDAPLDGVPMALPLAVPVEGDVPLALPVAAPMAAMAPVAPPTEAVAPSSIPCPACGATCPAKDDFCGDCGWFFSAADKSGNGAPAVAPAGPASRVQGRYELLELVGERGSVQRYKARDHEDGGTPVVLVRQPIRKAPPPPPPDPVAEEGDEIMPSFDDALAFPTTAVITGAPEWPSIAWERRLLGALESEALPRQLAHFSDEENEYLVLESPQGVVLWDVWDDPEGGSARKYGVLAQVAGLLHQLHQCNAMVESLRPDLVVVEDGKARLAGLEGLLPLPLPAEAGIKGTMYTAPEVQAGAADARADLYGFGAMLYSLHVGRELNERTDFDKPGHPKPFLPRFPDAHPMFGRLMMKTFRREPGFRFPTDEAGKTDPTGFLELIATLETMGRIADTVRLEISSWTNTGIIRTGNEDAFALLHATESRQDDLGEAALILLCDGMGGYEAGEVAAAMALCSLRSTLSKLPAFAAVGGASPFPADASTPPPREQGHAGPPLDVEAAKAALKSALKEANRAVFTASRAPGSKRRGMGCTAEAVYIDGRNLVVGHVGDSRTYHLH
ncbi:MAG: hypothetical protein K2W96_05845, partial [Gemmataceae bacterium]|nr:hypothetical protein [Gemmataceae bacterium]